MPAAGCEISVAVATRGRPERLGRLLDSLEAQTLPPGSFEVLVAVDGPDEATEALLAERALASRASLRAVVLDRTAGPGAARNAAWRMGTAPLVAFTDDDCEPAPTWLETLLAASREHPQAAFQGPTLPNPADLANEGPFSRTQRIPGPTPWYQTCNMAYRRELLERLSGFDEALTDAGEDADLGWRAVQAGTEVRFLPNALVLHAIEDIGPVGHLRRAAFGGGSIRIYKRYPELRRRTAFARIFWKRTHAFLLLAAAGLFTGRRYRPALLLTLPYAKGLRGRARQRAQGWQVPGLAAFLVLWDLVDLATAVKASIRYRLPMI